MKKLFLFLVVFCVMFGCKGVNESPNQNGKEPNKIDWSNAKVGDKGEGEGIIFHIEKGKLWEVSSKLGASDWEKAEALCKEYRGGGFNDWYLPSKDELDWVYKDLVETEKIENMGIFWSSTSETNGKAWEENFYSGFQYENDKTVSNSVRAVRVFTP